MQRIKIHLTIILISLLGVSCTKSSSDGDNDGNPPPLSTNACSVIGLNTRIINGTACSETNSPVVRIAISTPEGEFECSGSMITSTDVLSAAHCFLGHSASRVFVLSGGHFYEGRAVSHPQAQITGQGAETRVNNDVAIVHLTNSPNLPTLPIFVSRPIAKDDIISIYGFGLDEAGNSGVLRSGQSRVDSVTDQHIIAKFNGEGSNSCNGDSGGPAILTALKDGQEVDGIVGLVSSGTVVTCAAGDTSLYSNVTSANLLNFVQSESPGVNLL